MKRKHKNIKNAIRLLETIGYMASDMRKIHPSPLNRYGTRHKVHDAINDRAKKSVLL